MSARPGPGATALRWTGGVLGAVALVAGGLRTADHLARNDTTTTHSYAAAGSVELVTDGDVTVTTGGTAVEVVARARTGLTAATYAVDEVDEGEGRLEIHHECTGVLDDTCTASLEVRVPEGARVTVRSAAGDVSVADVVGDVTVSTNTGAVTVTEVGGSVTAATGAGDVEVSRVGGSAEVTTSVGAVTVRDVHGDAVVDGGAGDLDVGGVLGDVRATTSNGRVVVRSSGGPVALDIASAKGRSTVDAPTDPGASRSVYIRSGNGDVSYVE
ncbi:DUF4097 family beta strand repeat protein [Actinotalea ferrariae]|uniref:hypothetical protein n=1 Tax=Actinotalea ferrariae TaxID=1386098 RepID=UPI001C8C864C|nr:hypothetical protein [Actinotalea ferrariae]MBX9246409.1 DUF4097 family beta strand repeat protein [Actinotalea ferrariae]